MLFRHRFQATLRRCIDDSVAPATFYYAVRRNAADLMTKDEALEVAVKIARLQGYGKPSQLTRDPSSRADRASKTTQSFLVPCGVVLACGLSLVFNFGSLVCGSGVFGFFDICTTVWRSIIGAVPADGLSLVFTVVALVCGSGAFCFFDFLGMMELHTVAQTAPIYAQSNHGSTLTAVIP
jgi:hypothetical protein